MPCQHLVRDDPQRIDVGAFIDRKPARLFGRHVSRRSQHLAIDGHRHLALLALGQAKVHQMRLVVQVHHDVAGLQVAMNDAGRHHAYPSRVRFEIAEGDLTSYRRAADFLNISNVDVVCVQHEFGIFGGPSGSHVLALLRELKMPVVTTLHTVLRDANVDQRRVMQELVTRSTRLVVMTERGRQMLQDLYQAPPAKIDLIPHGIPDMPFVDPSYYKDQFGVEGRVVLLTFGLLSPNKGIEHVLATELEVEDGTFTGKPRALCFGTHKVKLAEQWAARFVRVQGARGLEAPPSAPSAIVLDIASKEQVQYLISGLRCPASAQNADVDDELAALMRRAPCPVWTIQPWAAESAVQFSVAVVGVDPSREARAAAHAAAGPDCAEGPASRLFRGELHDRSRLPGPRAPTRPRDQGAGDRRGAVHDDRRPDGPARGARPARQLSNHLVTEGLGAVARRSPLNRRSP